MAYNLWLSGFNYVSCAAGLYFLVYMLLCSALGGWIGFVFSPSF
jgi:hypothetical protein